MKRAFPGSGPEIDARYERAGKWLLATVFGRKDARDWCDKSGVSIRKAASEGIGSGGGFLVPTELENAILDIRDTYGVLRRRACLWPMGSDSSVFPRRTADATAYFLAEGASAATGASASLNIDGVQLTAKKLAAMVTLSSELDEDSIIDLVDYVADQVAWAIAAKEDDCGFNGDGTAAYGGIRGICALGLDGNHNVAKVTAASGHNTFAGLTSPDLAGLVAAVRASALPRAAWYVSQTAFGQAIVNEATGGYLYNGKVDGIDTPFYDGFPVILTQKLPLISTTLSGKVMMAFGDLYGGTVLGQRRGLTLARSDHRYLDTDQIAILATTRLDVVTHDMGDNANAGSLAVLVGN